VTAVTRQAGSGGGAGDQTGRAGPAGPGTWGGPGPGSGPGTGSGPGPGGGPGTGGWPGGPSPGGAGAVGWRRWRAPAALVAIILAGGTVIALLQTGPVVTGPLDPRDVGPGGTHALAALLAGQGKRVSTVDTAAAALAQSMRPHTALVVADPGRVGPASLPALAATPADLLIVAPGPRALAALTRGVTPAAQAPVANHPPRCTWPGARLAGPADMGGLLLRSTAPGAWRCYPVSRAATPGGPGGRAGPGAPPRTRYASLVRYRSGGRIITVLGTGAPLTNRDLGRGGNAALALNLLAGDSRIVWLVPGPAASSAPGAARSRSVSGLIPAPVYLVIAELAVALVLAALWRMRRFGPLVFEPLPVVVRASETAEGHGALYRSRRARDRAAAALRAATLARLTARTGLPQTASPEAVGRELAGRTGRGEQEIRAMLYGPVPRDDAALVKLATDLDTLEEQVLAQ
jgi:Domain of unknown function (DUF4350)